MGQPLEKQVGGVGKEFLEGDDLWGLGMMCYEIADFGDGVGAYGCRCALCPRH